MAITDGNWRLLEHDEALGRTVWVMFDGRQTHFRTDYRADKIVQSNQRERNDAPGGWKGDWHKAASIPLNVYHDSGMHDAIGQKDNRFISRWLNDSDNRAWMTREGRF